VQIVPESRRKLHNLLHKSTSSLKEPEHQRVFLRKDVTNAAEAESCFRSAIEHAQRHGAKSLELRATLSLARLLDQTGRRDEARTMLAEIYGWFTEGFDTGDLKDAKALLDELNE
jgi:predicted ATPase